MFEKVNPMHPDKIADRIAGALVDYAYLKDKNPRIAVEVLIGHDKCFIIAETSVDIPTDLVNRIVGYITDTEVDVNYVQVPQDKHLADNQNGDIRCGDNGIFKGMPTTEEQKKLTSFAFREYHKYFSDGKYFTHNNNLTVCQSNATYADLLEDVLPISADNPGLTKINPLGPWTGGVNVDSGATNRKLGSDMGDAITGGGLHGKDLSKADVSINIYAYLLAQERNEPVEISCSIGDDEIFNGKEFVPYSEVVEIARNYINEIGGFEEFAEWGLIRP